MRTIAIAMLLLLRSSAADLPAEWSVVSGGQWQKQYDVRPVFAQRAPAGEAHAIHGRIRGAAGAWRCLVQPALDATACGMWFQASPDLTRGFRCELGGTPGIGGLSLRDARGQKLWADEYAPCAPYDAYVIEGIVERGRVRVQMLHYDRRTLISQSDWVPVSADATSREGRLGVYTRDGMARFYGAERADKPLHPLTDDAPNKRRIVPSRDRDWALFGTGNWMWTDKRRVRLRQYARTERAWALHRPVQGVNRVWTTAVRVGKRAGGAGMLFQTNEDCRGGYNCWLGGRPGRGSLMLYHNAGPGGRGKALWSSKQNLWHYNEDLVLRAETKDGRVRVQLLKADATTVVAASPWISDAAAGKPGYLGFHTWRDSAEFWGFTDGAQVEATPRSAPTASSLGPGWITTGGDWHWANEARSALRQTARTKTAACLNTKIDGARGAWRCTVVPAKGEVLGLLFQADESLAQGFLCLLSPGRLALYGLAQPNAAKWEDANCGWLPGGRYVLEGLVQTDRVVVRLLQADGRAVVAESPAVYVPDRNNDRSGHIGFATRRGPGTFMSWEFEPEH